MEDQNGWSDLGYVFIELVVFHIFTVVKPITEHDATAMVFMCVQIHEDRFQTY